MPTCPRCRIELEETDLVYRVGDPEMEFWVCCQCAQEVRDHPALLQLERIARRRN